LMRGRTDVSSIRDRIVFGRPLAEQAGADAGPGDATPAAAIAAGAADAGPRWQAA
jgi:hypothetical protein